MSGRVIVVTSVGAASGSRAAAAALACAGSEPDRPGLLVDVGGRPPRPTLLASSGARELEERLAVHRPALRAVSRGQTCHLAVDPGEEGHDGIRAALPLVRDSVAVLHVPPASCRELLGAGLDAGGVLLRADLAVDRALTAMVVGELCGMDLLVRVLKRPLAWVSARRALFGVLPPESPGAFRVVSGNPFWKAKFQRRTRATLGRMTKKLTQRELRNNSGEVMRALDAGEDFIVTSNGRPVGELRPYPHRKFITREAFVDLFAGSPPIDYERFRADIDRYADQDPTPRG